METIPGVPLHGVYAYYKQKGLFLTDVLAFTVLRSIALLHTRAGKLVVTLILVGLALMLVIADTVRLRRFHAMVPSGLLRRPPVWQHHRTVGLC